MFTNKDSQVLGWKEGSSISSFNKLKTCVPDAACEVLVKNSRNSAGLVGSIHTECFSTKNTRKINVTVKSRVCVFFKTTPFVVLLQRSCHYFT